MTVVENQQCSIQNPLAYILQRLYNHSQSQKYLSPLVDIYTGQLHYSDAVKVVAEAFNLTEAQVEEFREQHVQYLENDVVQTVSLDSSLTFQRPSSLPSLSMFQMHPYLSWEQVDYRAAADSRKSKRRSFFCILYSSNSRNCSAFPRTNTSAKCDEG